MKIIKVKDRNATIKVMHCIIKTFLDKLEISLVSDFMKYLKILNIFLLHQSFRIPASWPTSSTICRIKTAKSKISRLVHLRLFLALVTF